jgi:DNA anti-recombination protein RmuC
MKEGYFQKKLTELTEKQQSLSSSLKLLNAEIDRIEARIGGLKPIIKRLNDVEAFKEKTLSEIYKINAEKIDKMLDEFAEELKKQVRDVTRKKADILEDGINQIQEDKELFKKYAESISTIESEISYVKEFHRLLVMKLVNKGVLSYHEQEEINRRSSKKTK